MLPAMKNNVEIKDFMMRRLFKFGEDGYCQLMVCSMIAALLVNSTGTSSSLLPPLSLMIGFPADLKLKSKVSPTA
jgi:hypothetical protein